MRRAGQAAAVRALTLVILTGALPGRVGAQELPKYLAANPDHAPSLLLQTLIEPELRGAMAEADLESLPMYPACGV